MSSNAVCCPNCSGPLLCDVETKLRFTKKNIPVMEQGVDIMTEQDEKADTLPVMYSDDNCICCGFYGNISYAPDAVYIQYRNLRCPECGELKDYVLYRENSGEKYRIVKRNDLHELKVSKYLNGITKKKSCKEPDFML